MSNYVRPLRSHCRRDAAVRDSTKFAAIRAGGQPVTLTLAARYHVCGLQQWQTAQPQTGCLCLAVPVLPRLHDLAIPLTNDFHSVFVRNGILDAARLCVGSKTFDKELSRRFHCRPPTRHRMEPTHTTVAQVGTWRMENRKIVIVIHNLSHIALQMVWRVIV